MQVPLNIRPSILVVLLVNACSERSMKNLSSNIPLTLFFSKFQTSVRRCSAQLSNNVLSPTKTAKTKQFTNQNLHFTFSKLELHSLYARYAYTVLQINCFVISGTLHTRIKATLTERYLRMAARAITCISVSLG